MEQEVDRRLTAVETRLDSIDLHGTRGMEGVRVELSAVQRDMGKMEATIGRLAQGQESLRDQILRIPRPRAQWPALIPLYALAIAVLGAVSELIASRL